jgi:diguanylate cyclase (GGDEF)-like protein
VLAAHLIVAAVFLLDRGGFLDGLNAFFEDSRTTYAQRHASGDVVLVAIDARSIREIGEWPWSRQIHADILNRLADAGAIDVLFDIDFGFASDEAGDAAFADALERFGTAYLPVFQQAAQAGDAERLVNRPLSRFADRSWPAVVNVFSDARGVIRFYPFGKVIDGEYIPSAAALLHGSYREREGSFPINFSVRPDTVPILSAVDAATGRFNADALAGRSVIVGASAIELGDLHAVPVHGILPGPLVHVLAAETLAANIVPRRLDAAWMCLGLLAGLLALGLRIFTRPILLVAAALTFVVASEAAAFSLFATGSIIVPTAGLYPGLLAFCSWTLLRRLAINRVIINRQRREVENTSALLSQVFTDSSDAIVIIDESGRVQMRSDTAEKLFGFDGDGELVLPQRLRSEALSSMGSHGNGSLKSLEILTERGLLHLEYIITPSQSVVFEGAGERLRKIATLSIRDVSRIKEQEREIAYISTHDDLTGAIRRSLLVDFMNLRMAAGEPFTVFVWNLSRFKTVNVVLGRDVGDQLLKNIVTRLAEAGLNISTTARLGGDTFACFTEYSTDAAQAAESAQRLADVVTAPYDLDQAKAEIGVKVGYSVISPDDGLTAAEALSQAEEALDHAKLSGNSSLKSYDASVHRSQFRSRTIERAMGQALDRAEFEIWYQPQHAVNDLRLVGSEALLRWTSESLGQIYPDEFIAIAESTGFIKEVGSWVLEKAIQDTMSLPDELGVAVNVSAIQMAGDDFVGSVSKALSTPGFHASRLWLELTETVLFSGQTEIIEKMQDVQFLGARWALDDFGTGYSSLSYLSMLPINKVKLDKSFLTNLDNDPAALGILTAISDICTRLDKILLCEGVETEAHLTTLRQLNCAELQGYLLAKPMPFHDYSAYVSHHDSVSLTART